MAAAVLVACATALLAVSQKAEAVLPGKNGRIDLSRDVSVPKRCEAGGSSVCRGTQYDDHITGTPNDDTIKSLEGRDYVLGRDGDDTAFGGPGNDTIQGADGRDYLYGGEGSDSLFGGVGPDIIRPAQGEDEVQAGAGDDRIYAPRDVLADRISCGKGHDWVLIAGEDHIPKDCEAGGIDNSHDVLTSKKCETEGPSVCRGTQYDDHITGTPNDDTIKALEGWDDIQGHDGDDTAFGGPGTDYLYGGEGSDSLFGGVGPDGIYPAQGEDEVQAGAGDDRIQAPHDGSADRISCGKGDDRVVSGKEDHIAKDCEVSRPASGAP